MDQRALNFSQTPATAGRGNPDGGPGSPRRFAPRDDVRTERQGGLCSGPLPRNH